MIILVIKRTEVKSCVPCYMGGVKLVKALKFVVSLHKSIGVGGGEVVLRHKAGYSYAKRIQSESYGSS